MENNRGSDGITNQDLHNRGTQHQIRREASHYGFEGMNFEQQRESYKMNKSHGPQNDLKERSNSRKSES